MNENKNEGTATWGPDGGSHVLRQGGVEGTFNWQWNKPGHMGTAIWEDDPPPYLPPFNQDGIATAKAPDPDEDNKVTPNGTLISSLTPGYRRIYDMWASGDYRKKEVAKNLGISVATVGNVSRKLGIPWQNR